MDCKILKHIIVFMLLLSSSFSSMSELYAQNDRLILTLDSALEIAKERNRDMLIAGEEINKADAMVSEAWSGALPEITMSNIYSRNILKPAFFVKFGDVVQKLEIGQNNSYQSMINFRQPLWLGGKVGTALKIAKAYESATESGFSNTWNTIEARVKTAFYSVLLTKEAKRIAGITLEHSEAHYENVKKRYALV